MLAPEAQHRVRDVFHAAIELNVAERRAFVEQVCALEQGIMSEVLALLEAHGQAEGFLEQPVAAIGDQVSMGSEAALNGHVIGAYRLLRAIARGGMGTVYLAERADGSYRQHVAVKVLEPEMVSEQLLFHHQRERQALAALGHPSIARLLDAGTSPEGIHFLVMEYVDGVPVDRYCDDHALSIESRLRLFQKICTAIAYAHRHLVVHRDLKPSNIFVTPEGEVKLLDFGIAKLLAEGAGGPTPLESKTQCAALTPQYASPEQIRGEPVSTATDVYSLGVLLFELLTGQVPYRLRDPSLAGLVRVICETESPRASESVLAATVPAGAIDEPGASSAAFAARGEDSRQRLSSRLSGDLDNIVAMALRKEPQRRYRSVEDLGEDIRRHLDGYPVLACGNGVIYRAQRFIRRHRVLVTAAALMAVVVATGLAAVLQQSRIAERERARAERQFTEIREIANSFLFDVHDAIQDLPGATSARRLVVDRALKYLQTLSSESGEDPGLMRELAAAYERVGSIQGNPSGPNLGDTAGALASYRIARRMREELLLTGDLRPATKREDLRRELAATDHKIGEILWWSGDSQGAVRSYRRAEQIRLETWRTHPSESLVARDLAQTYTALGEVDVWDGRPTEAGQNYARALSILAQATAANPGDRELARDSAVTHTRAGEALGWAGDSAGATPEFEQATRMLLSLLRTSPTDARSQRALMVNHVKHGDLVAEADPRAAQSRYRSALALAERLAATDSANTQAQRDLALVNAKMGEALLRLRDLTGALGCHRRALEIQEALSARDPSRATPKLDLANAHQRIGDVLVASRDDPAALTEFRATLLLREEVARSDPDDLGIRRDIASVCARLGAACERLGAESRHDATAAARRRQEAREWFGRAIGIWNALKAEGAFREADAETFDEISERLSDLGR